MTENDLDYVNKFLEEGDAYNLFSQSMKYNEQDFINFKMLEMLAKILDKSIIIHNK